MKKTTILPILAFAALGLASCGAQENLSGGELDAGSSAPLSLETSHVASSDEKSKEVSSAEISQNSDSEDSGATSSLDSDTTDSSETSSDASNEGSQTVVEIAGDCLNQSNITISLYDTEFNSRAKYLFDGNVVALVNIGNDGEEMTAGYYVLTDAGVTAYYRAEEELVQMQTIPYHAEKLTGDFLFAEFVKESFSELLSSFDMDELTEEEGVYHINKLMFHIDGAKAAAIVRYEGEVTGDGAEYPMMDIDFTIEEGHLSTLKMTSGAFQVSSNGNIVVDLDTHLSTYELTFSDYGTTSFEIPEMISSLIA